MGSRLRLTVAIAAVLSSSAQGDVPPPTGACQTDSACLITTFSGCCGTCCGAQPYAIASADLKKSQGRCAAIDCAPLSCQAVRCAAREPASGFRAVCRSGACVAEKIAAPIAECRFDSECAIGHPTPPCRPGPCGCCPGTEPQAFPLSRAAPSPAVPDTSPPKQTAKGDVPFGLSDPQTRPPDPVNCSPCPGPRPAQARCSAGRCVVARQPRPPG